MSPEKERRLLEVGQAYEIAVQRVSELQEKLNKLRASEREVHKQLETAANMAERLQRDMFEVVVSDLPRPDRHDVYGTRLVGQDMPIVRVSDLGRIPASALPGAMSQSILDSVGVPAKSSILDKIKEF